MDSSLEDLGNILDEILDIPPNDWTIKQLNLYQALEKKCIKYRRHFLITQFRLDLVDICDNIRGQKWHSDASVSVRKAIDNLLEQLKIMSFNLTRQEETLRMNLDLSLENSHIKLQYLSSPDKFIYYLYFERSEDGLRAYLAKNNKVLADKTDVSQKDLDILYREILDPPLRKIPVGILYKIIAEIIMFYEETRTVLSTPIRQESLWSLQNFLEAK